MAISAKDVMSLRQRTGLGMMECKEALTEVNGDIDAAIELLREKLKGKMEERSGREAGEGVVAIARNSQAAAIIKLNSETDFVARNESFIADARKLVDLALQCPAGDVTPTDEMKKIVDELRITTKENVQLAEAKKLEGEKVGAYLHHNNQVGVIVSGQGDLSDELLTGICQHLAAAVPTPLAVDEAGLPDDAVEAQKQQAIKEAEESGKPREIAEKIATGKLRKWVDENTLLGQVYLREMDAKKPVRDYLPKGAKIAQFVRYKLGG